MKLLLWPMMVLALALLLSSAPLSQKPPLSANNGVVEPVNTKTDLYPADADAKNEINEAVKSAATSRKRVLLIFGANWCYDCHVLDRALHDGAAGQIVKEGFLLVHVDIGEMNKNLDLAKHYKIPMEKGVPAVAILSGDGKLLYSSGDGEFEAARKMMKKELVAFLNRWKESPLQNRERTGVPARAARVGWWMRPGPGLKLESGIRSLPLAVL